MRKLHPLAVIVLAGFFVSCSGWLSNGGPDVTPPVPTGPSATLATSLHGTANGMAWWYNQPDGAGALFGVDYATTGCGSCHVETCDQCHVNADGTGGVNEPDSCNICHGRQVKEEALGVTDVHKDAGMLCSDCHSAEDMHGDGTTPDSMLSHGAMNVSCEDCHTATGTAVNVPDTAAHTVHGDALSCDACHMSSSVTCYNCHFETLLDSHEKKAAAAFKDFVFLLNDQDGVVRAGTYQSVTYENKSFIAFGPFHGHSVQSEGRGCADCHGNERIQELNADEQIQVSWWDDGESKVMHTTGAIPFVPGKLAFQFLDFNGTAWVPLKTEIDQLQYEFCTPLDDNQLAALGYTGGTATAGPAGTLPSSLHGSARGMEWWYNQPDGLGDFIDLEYAATGCGSCHVETCDQCHVNADGTGGVNEPDACAVCHGRQAKEQALGVTDVHTTAGMLCSECHSEREMHGDGTSYNSMLEHGAMDTKCENCHGAGGGPAVPTTQSHTVHTNMSCDACHMSSAVTCYNCHFETLLTSHEKKPAGAFKDFILLLNDQDGMIRAGTYQSVYYQDKGFAAFGPFHGHSVQSVGRACEDCHANELMQELADTGEIELTSWDAGEGKVMHKTGVIPFVPDAFKFQFLDFDGTAWGPVDPSEVQFQWEFCTPLDTDQLASMAILPPQVTLPTSLHATAAGMEWWYNQPDGLGSLISLTYEETGCGMCHVDTTTDDGGCSACHGDNAVTEPIVDQNELCKGCHGRQAAEANLGYTDVHLTAGMECSDCHMTDIHGDGNVYNSMWEPGAVDVDCENCHADLNMSIAEHTIHSSTIHCDACHLETVITCNNCHFDSLIETHAKKPYRPFGGFMLLVNDDKSGKVRAGTYQSVVEGAGENTFIAFGPFHGHTVTAAGRHCADCHDSARITELNDNGNIVMTRWDDTLDPPGLVHATGVIPFVPDQFVWEFVDYDSGADTWSPIGAELDLYQYEFCTPLDAGQLAALGVE